jgi:hypothetical protein
VKRGIDHRAQAQALRVVGHALGMVARAHGDHAARALPGAQLGQLVAGAAFLEGGGELQVLELEEDLRAGQLRQRARLHEGVLSTWGATLLAAWRTSSSEIMRETPEGEVICDTG